MSTATTMNSLEYYQCMVKAGMSKATAEIIVKRDSNKNADFLTTKDETLLTAKIDAIGMRITNLVLGVGITLLIAIISVAGYIKG